jgi:hypothetical protein
MEDASIEYVAGQIDRFFQECGSVAETVEVRR